MGPPSSAAAAAAATARHRPPHPSAAASAPRASELGGGVDEDDNDFDDHDTDDFDDATMHAGGGGKNFAKADVPSHDDEGDDDDAPGSSNTPIQKRRRVTRACDECRRKKIKCDGKQPCTHCTVYSYECTYDQPSNRRRNPGPIYIHQLESRLQQSSAVLQALLPGVDIFRQGFDINRFVEDLKAKADGPLSEMSVVAHQLAGAQPLASADVRGLISASASFPGTAASTRASSPASSLATPSAPPADKDKDTNMESMVVSLGRLDVDETGHLDYVGHSSGRAFLQHVRAHFLNDHPDAIPADFPRTAQFYYSPQTGTPTGIGDSAILSDDSPPDFHYYQQMAEFKIILPSKEVAQKLMTAVWDQACVVLAFAHKPSITQRLEDLYATDPDDFTPAQISFLPLVYCFLAVGVLFTSDIRRDAQPSQPGDNTDVGDGYKYFVAARNMIDITEARDTDAIQAIILMVMFLQSTARLSTCYSYIGVAQRAALRLGLHRKVSYNFNPVEVEVRKRIFWTIRKMDTHLSAMLGLPRCIDENDIDQEQPLEIDDEYITEQGILPHPFGSITIQTVANAHTRLMRILSHIVEDVYPIKARAPTNAPGGAASNCVSYARVLELENELKQWFESLPMELRPGLDPPAQWLPANRVLHMAFCYVKIILYRPFIHYVGQRYRDKLKDERPYACAMNCISTSRIVVHLADDLYRRGVLRGAHLFSVYTIFFATAVLIYYVHEDPSNSHVKEWRRDAELGKNVIEHLKNKSVAAARTFMMLQGLFQLLDKSLATVKKEPGTADDSKRKRGTTADRSLRRTASGTMLPAQSNSRSTLRQALTHQRRSPPSQKYPLSATQQPLTIHAPATSQVSGVSRITTSDLPRLATEAPLIRASTFPLSAESVRSGVTPSPSSGGYASPGSYSSLLPYTESPLSNMPAPQDNLFAFPGLDAAQLQDMPASNSLYVGDITSNPSRQDEDIGGGYDAIMKDGDVQTGYSGTPGAAAGAEGDPAMMTYSTGPMDKLEAQLFGRFLPPYMYSSASAPNMADESAAGVQQGGTQDGAVYSVPNDYVVDSGAIMGGGGPFLGHDADTVSFKTANSSPSSMDLLSPPAPASAGAGPVQQPSPWMVPSADQGDVGALDMNGNSGTAGGSGMNEMTGFLGAFPDEWDEFLSQHQELSGLKNLM
ncbi:fungal-specific transcription factor domain-containing protein [Limtongia smithiae]|uniref:fungal-specific transcription factor domain-containing protein n=1 Tax=Limtongia smithiae TaxID=1125753 RepID=UPI0034CE169C